MFILLYVCRYGLHVWVCMCDNVTIHLGIHLGIHLVAAPTDVGLPPPIHYDVRGVVIIAVQGRGGASKLMTTHPPPPVSIGIELRGVGGGKD